MATRLIYLTDRDYQKALSDFMVYFQAATFTDNEGNKVNKITLFESVWQNHVDMIGGCFSVKVDTFCQLLHSGNHPEIRTVKREVPKFNEAELIKKALHGIMLGRAIAVVRSSPATSYTPDDVIAILVEALKTAYNEHERIDKEIDDIVTGH